MRDVCLYDAATDGLASLKRGDAIRIEVQRSDASHDAGVLDVVSSRSFVLFGLLQRFLRSEGFPLRFLFDGSDDPDVPCEVACDPRDELTGEELTGEELTGEEPAGEEPAGEEPAGEEPAGDDSLGETSMGKDEAAGGPSEARREEVERLIDIRFGERLASEQDGGGAGEEVSLQAALERFGPHAVTLYLLGTHYSQPLGDAAAGLEAGARNVGRIRDLLAGLRPGRPSVADMGDHVEAFRDALASDLDTPLALVAMFEWLLEAQRRGCGLGDEDLRMMLEMFELHDLVPNAGAA